MSVLLMGSPCICGPIDTIVCAKCGGIVPLNVRSVVHEGILQKVDNSIVNWIHDLDKEGRLNSTLATYWVIDKQFKQGASVGAAISQAMVEISTRISSLGENVETELTQKFDDVIARNEVTSSQLTNVVREIVKDQVDSVMSQVRLLLEQNKAVSEAGALLKEAAGSVQAVLASSKISSVKGEEAEIQTIQALQDAFFGVTGVIVEPIGGSDATDAIVKFVQSGIEMGRILVEIKARRTWSNDFLGQIRADMNRYSSSVAILIADKLPRNAKGKGFAIEVENGLVVTIGPPLVFQTVSMFYELHVSVFRLQKKALNINALSSNKDLTYFLNDNLKCLDECKQISDLIDDSSRKIKERLAIISERLQQNNSEIARVLSECEM